MIRIPLAILFIYVLQGDYNRARGHLTEAEETSNLDSNQELLGKRKRKIKEIRLPGKESEDEGVSHRPKCNFYEKRLIDVPYPAPPNEEVAYPASPNEDYICSSEYPATTSKSINNAKLDPS